MRRVTGRGCRVLLVEDEDMVRKVVVRTATNAREAKLLFNAANGEFDLLISDVMIPEGNGPELARELSARCPSLRVLFVSGYTGWSDAGGLDAEQVRFLTKPFGSAELTEMIEELLPLREA
jgi:two-component system cell cycle sensor histidine kinase/response regulator CckA